MRDRCAMCVDAYACACRCGCMRMHVRADVGVDACVICVADDFSAYVSSIESSSKAYGLCKVIPPKEFIARKKGYHFNGVGYAGTNPRCDPK
eukprot:1365546-Amorphochlora_amoeboformis.AAC.1